MNRELYIHTLSQFRDECDRKHMDTETEAFNAAIQALSADGDCISRQAAIDVIRNMQTYKMFEDDDTFLVDKAEAQTELRMLPSAQPETHEERTETHACDCISRQAAIDVEDDKWN